MEKPRAFNRHLKPRHIGEHHRIGDHIQMRIQRGQVRVGRTDATIQQHHHLVQASPCTRATRLPGRAVTDRNGITVASWEIY